MVRAIPVKGIKDKPRSFFDKLGDHAKALGSQRPRLPDLGDGDTVKGPIQKSLKPEELAALAEMGAKDGDVIFFLCDEAEKAAKMGGDIRVKLGRDLELDRQERLPLLLDRGLPDVREGPRDRRDRLRQPVLDASGRHGRAAQQEPARHPRVPVRRGLQLHRACCWIRNHLPEIYVYKAFEIAGMGPGAVEEILPPAERLPWRVYWRSDRPRSSAWSFYRARQHPRGDRFFPMNQKAQDLDDERALGCPEKQLRELHIKIRGHELQAPVSPGKVVGVLEMRRNRRLTNDDFRILCWKEPPDSAVHNDEEKICHLIELNAAP